jgi:hypothetical protein
MPDDIPAYPNTTYKKDFKGMGDFLGTGTVAPKDRTYRSFEDAREFAQNLGLKSGTEWKEYRKSDEMPSDIPSNPNRTYKKDFKGMGDFLGTGTVAPKDKVYRSFTDAREFVIPLNLKGLREWRSYCKSGNKPDDIPTAPEVTYKQDFKGMGDWLGTGRIAERDRLFRSFTDAREFARSLNLKNNTDWQKFIKKNKISDLSVRPDTTYKNKGWEGWGDFLNTGNIAPEDLVFRPFKDAREFVRKLNLKSWPEWREYCKSGNKPDDIPTAPWRTYKEWNKK